jgi:hypothetical protein
LKRSQTLAAIAERPEIAAVSVLPIHHAANSFSLHPDEFASRGVSSGLSPLAQRGRGMVSENVKGGS